MHQKKRMATYIRFCGMQHACLFATDIASRGLDFPSIDWVVQVDCPEDTKTYIHRVGRTARYNAKGQALLFLLPSEKKMQERLQGSAIPVKVLRVNPVRKVTIKHKLQAFLSSTPNLKYLAQKSFVSYMRSVFMKGDKETFDVTKLPAAEFAESLGLATIPRIRFANIKRSKKNQPYEVANARKIEEAEKITVKKDKSKIERILTRKNAGVFSEAYDKLRANSDESEDDLLVLKQRHNVQEEGETKPKQSQLKDDMKSITELDAESLQRNKDAYYQKIQKGMKEADVEDKKAFKERLRNQRRMEREAALQQLGDEFDDDDEEYHGVRLATPELPKPVSLKRKRGDQYENASLEEQAKKLLKSKK
eukprot:TRINITY_DN6735_c0_g1_i1.p1 TRINITY_DN6735_c0_g1~~TRINITY_DN6735_c0_g1_i1.p1  ORF type:complete len:364 (+),score=97.83 TRINITY_DN6735_c0_g1_i1:1065-2156(+)